MFIAFFCAFEGFEDAVNERLRGDYLQPLSAGEEICHKIFGWAKFDFVICITVAMRQVTLSWMHRQISHVKLLCAVSAEHNLLQWLGLA